ncbi:phosphatase PAP2 family protein [Arenimonas composti]|uniref:phosphatase PAP2 family protein n=1 Tax=Arenimonas composti TaxID=370776 RepID=UPI0006869828
MVHVRLVRRAIAAYLRARWRRLALAFAGVALPLMLFAFFAEDVHDGDPFPFDEPLLLAAKAHESLAMDRVMLVGSELGYRMGVVPVDFLLVTGLLATRRLRPGLFAAVAIGGSALLNLAAKAVFQRARPDLWLSIAPEHNFSFPSGHAMGSATLAATVLLLVWHTRWRGPAALLGLAFMVWVASSRIYLGVHWPSDIIAGWAAAIAWVVATYLIVRPRRAPQYAQTRLRPDSLAR